MAAILCTAALSATAGCSTGSTPQSVDIAFQEINGAPIGAVAVLGWEDDIDAERPGVQVSLRLRVDSVPADTAIRLQVGDQQLEGKTGESGEVEFPDVTLGPGMNVLQADCTSCNQVQHEVELFAPSLDITDFVKEPIAEATHDTDPSAAGIQHEFLIKAPQLPDNTVIDVSIGDTQLTAEVMNQEAYLRVSLPGDSGQMRVEASATVAGRIISADGMIAIHNPGCALNRIGTMSPEQVLDESGTIWLGQEDDESQAPGLQAAFEVEVGGLSGTRVEILANGAVLAEGTQDSSGRAVFADIVLAEDFDLSVRCLYDGAPAVTSRSYDVRVDLAAPAAVTDLSCSSYGSSIHCMWTSPQDPGRAGPVHTWELRYLVGDTITEESFSEAEAASVPLPNAPGMLSQVMFPIFDAPAGSVSVALISWDHAGNASPLSNVFTMPTP